ncbi:MAG: DUF1049 domain-containing protein [Actinobacteria bacterium]|nr:DUF1049 domain-containing protein [Actinomycetota bacterium]
MSEHQATEPPPETADEGPAQTVPVRPARTKGRDVPWRLIALGVLLVYGIVFVVLNSRAVKVNFVFFAPRVSLIVALVLALLLGFLGGYLFDTMRDRRKRKPGDATPS